MWLRSVARRCCPRCRSGVSLRSVARKCCSDVSLRNVAQECRSEVSLRYVCRNVARTVAQECHSEASLTRMCLCKVHVCDTHPKLARDCGARMISTSLDTFQACQNEPIVRQGQRKGRRRKHYHAPAKTTTPGTQILMARQRERAAFQNTAPAQRCNRHDSRTGTTNSALQDSSKSHFLRQSQWHGNFFHMRTLADAFERFRTLADAFGHTQADQRTQPYPQTPLNNGNPSQRIRENYQESGP